MTDDPVPEGPGENGSPDAGAAGPAGGPRTAETRTGAPERELRKGEDDRVLAGVCSGLGRYTGVDPVVWRAAFVLIVFVGATGLLLYIAAWMLMRDARGGPATFEQMLNRSIPPRAVLKLLALGVAVAAMFSLVGDFGWSTLMLMVPLVLGLLTARNRGVDLRAAFMDLREDLRVKGPPPTGVSPGPTPTYYNPAQPWASAPHGPVDLAVVAERSASADGPDDDADDDGGGNSAGGNENAPSQRPEGTEKTCWKGRSLALPALVTIVAGGVLAPLLVFGWSSSLWSAQTATLLFGPETGVYFLAGALAVVGLYALAGTWVGNPGGLMFLGLTVALVLAAASVADLTRIRIGEERWRPTTVAEAETVDSRLTVGSETLDLTGLEDLEPGETADVSLRVDVGHTVLVLPRDARVEVTSEAGFVLADHGQSGEGGEVFEFSLSERIYRPVGGSATGSERSEGPREEGAEDGDGAGPPLINVRTGSLVGIVEVRHGEA